MMEHRSITLIKGFLGMAASGGSAAVSFMTQIEAGLRVTSLLVGIAVGLVTIRSLLKRKGPKDE